MKKIYDKSGNEIGKLSTDSQSNKDFESYVEKYVGDELKELKDTLFPIGTVLINEWVGIKNDPKIVSETKWICLGELKNGQSIIGGSDSNGSNISHSHTQESHAHHLFSPISGTSDNFSGERPNYYIGRYGSLSTSNNDYALAHTDNKNHYASLGLSSHKTPTIHNSAGGTQNKAWGIGLGTKYIWKRIE